MAGSPAQVPESTSLLMLAGALVGLLALSKRPRSGPR